ncbi:hypothetical protein BJX66DRAFT_333640 [Aspergillus keveii]|uniref:Uncharacterized protein n=1 Tax=Aspergillus keveii TaxID=714993 RepID=A0ABR4GIS5_9EURO
MGSGYADYFALRSAHFDGWHLQVTLHGQSLNVAAIALLLGTFLPLSWSLPLTSHYNGNNGQFAFVDSIYTVIILISGISPLGERDASGYLRHHRTCNYNDRLPPANEPSSILLKCIFVLAKESPSMARHPVERVNNWEHNGALPGSHYSFERAHSAHFRVLGGEPVEMVLNGMGSLYLRRPTLLQPVVVNARCTKAALNV